MEKSDMKGMMSVKRTAESWRISERRVTELCRTGRVEGAVRDGRRWMIPIYAEKPSEWDYAKEGYVEYSSATRPMVQGAESYEEASSGQYFVDKTLLIRDVLMDSAKVLLFTRPRRFGKSLNLDMLRVFFERTDDDTSVHFRNRKIWRECPGIREEQGRYPVVFLTLKDAVASDMDSMTETISWLISEEYGRHPELAGSEALSLADRELYIRTVARKLSPNELTRSLYMLTRMLSSHWKEKVMIMIDEYDVPIANGHLNGFLDEITGFIRIFLGQALKSNPHLMKGILTGIMRVAKESIFSGLNNVSPYSILDERYSEYFGFTEDEMRAAASYYGASDRLPEIEEWYDGYVFGGRRIYNPWSAANYFNHGLEARTWWEHAGENRELREMLRSAGRNAEDVLTRLLDGESVVTTIDTATVYPPDENDLSAILSLLAVSGYLRAERVEDTMPGTDLWRVSIPNREIKAVWNDEILRMVSGIWKPNLLSGLQTAVMAGDEAGMEKGLSDLLIGSVSWWDTQGENFYHGLLLGLTALFTGYRVRSNRESGLGRFDIMLIPVYRSWPGIVIEVKALKNASEEELERAAEAAVSQAETMRYSTELETIGTERVLIYGAAFSGKNVVLKTGGKD